MILPAQTTGEASPDRRGGGGGRGGGGCASHRPHLPDTVGLLVHSSTSASVRVCGGARDSRRVHAGLAGPLAVLSSALLVSDNKREAEDEALERGPAGYQGTGNLQGETKLGMVRSCCYATSKLLKEQRVPLIHWLEG